MEKSNSVKKIVTRLGKYLNINIQNPSRVLPIESLGIVGRLESLEIGTEKKEPFLVDNESDASTLCLTPVTSICSNASMENDFAPEKLFIPENFKMILTLGIGTYGAVFLAEYPDGVKSKQKYAVKKLSKNRIDEDNIKQIMDEKSILEELDSPFTLKLFGTCQTNDELFLVTELIDCGELFMAIYYNEKIPNDMCIFYSACIILGLDHIHSKGIVFRDLKPENIMIDSLGYPRIVDFGLSKHLPSIETCKDGTIRKKTHCETLCGTPEYFAPEIIFTTGYNYAVDIWALGIIMYEMIMRTNVFIGRDANDLTQLFTNIAHTKKNGILLPQKVDLLSGNLPHARNLITQLLSGDPKKRLAGKDMPGSLLEHEYFSSIKNNVNDLKNCSFKPSLLQPKYDGEYIFTNRRSVNVYTGDQEIFKDF